MKFLTYLGNKRKLITHIVDLIQELPGEGPVLDLFSGSGVVSWHLRKAGCTVHANDIGPYTYPINQAHLAYSPSSLSARFPDLDGELARLNGLTEPKNGKEYFSKYYSENLAASYERLFYTRRNGLFIDAVLGEIHSPGYDPDMRDIVLSDLLFKMGKHVNTNGHFKTFHKAFGGLTNRHDVERITTPIVLERPEVLSEPIGKSFCLDANEFVSKIDTVYKCAYLDPPYNQHQYSANYHLLEAACLPLDKRYVPRDTQVSGIDPSLYKSPYCSKQKCMAAFSGLVTGLQRVCNSLVISYNSKGFISMDSMRSFLESKGDVEVKSLDNLYRIGTRKSGTAKKPERDVREYLFRVKFKA